jgi:hypothetical protein
LWQEFFQNTDGLATKFRTLKPYEAMQNPQDGKVILEATSGNRTVDAG